MTQQDNKLTPDEGKVLTNGETYSFEVFLGIYDSSAKWHEVPIEEMPQEEPLFLI